MAWALGANGSVNLEMTQALSVVKNKKENEYVIIATGVGHEAILASFPPTPEGESLARDVLKDLTAAAVGKPNGPAHSTHHDNLHSVFTVRNMVAAARDRVAKAEGV